MAVMSASRKSKQRSNSDSTRLLPLLVCRSSHLLGGPGLGMCREAKEFPYGFLILEYKPQMHSVAHKAHSPLSFTTNLHGPRISESHSGYPCLPFPMIAPQHFFSPPSNLVCCPRHLEFITRWLYLTILQGRGHIPVPGLALPTPAPTRDSPLPLRRLSSYKASLGPVLETTVISSYPLSYFHLCFPFRM